MWLVEKLLGRGADAGHTVAELSRRLGMDEAALRAVGATYRRFEIPKRSGGTRTIHAPDGPLKELQRCVLYRLLARLPVHPAVTGFERRHSIVTNAAHHTGKAIVLQLDIKDFFGSMSATRVEAYFRGIGWNKEAARLLRSWCTYEGGLPQGAPTSPRLSNVVNYRLDARLAACAAKYGAAYTRYADDITFSFAVDDRLAMRTVLYLAGRIVEDEGYELHRKRKCHIRRRHQRQMVTGLVVNERPRLPRETRRWLRAVEHHHATDRPSTVTPGQLQGWRALGMMVETQWRSLNEQGDV